MSGDYILDRHVKPGSNEKAGTGRTPIATVTQMNNVRVSQSESLGFSRACRGKEKKEAKKIGRLLLLTAHKFAKNRKIHDLRRGCSSRNSLAVATVSRVVH
jgi:hypothetical protein